MATKQFLERVTKELVDKGKLVEAGWVGLRLACDLENAPADQLREMRMAFFAGAQHLFASLNSMMDAGEEPTDADLRRMDLINEELQHFVKELEARLPPEPPAAEASVPRPPPTLGDAPIEAEYNEMMNRVARVVDGMFNADAKKGARHTGFVLLVFPFDTHAGRCNYISNADRSDVVILLKEQLARFEGQPEMTGHA